MHETFIPLFYIRPIDALNEFCIDNMLKNMKIKHDAKTGSGKFFKQYIGYKSDRRYFALFGETINIFLYPPNAERDFWILKTEENKNGGVKNGKEQMA